MREHLAAQESLDAAVFQQRNLLGVPQVGIGLVLDRGGLVVDRGREQAAERIGCWALLVIFLMTGGASSVRSAVSLSDLISLGE